MDFKAALQAEIEAKKRQLDKFGKNGNSVKVSEIERQKEEEYLAKQRELDSQREKKLQEKLAKISNSKDSRNSDNNNSNEKDSLEGTNVERGEESCVDVSTNREVERQLKQRGQPIRLFGETDRQRMARLKLLELREEELSGGQRNDFNELLEQENEGSVSKRVKQSDDMAAFASIKDISIRIDRVLLLKDRELAIKTVLLFLRILLKEWQCDLDGRPDETKKSTAGRMVSATFQQTKDYLVPFFKMLQSDDLPADILAHLVDIIGFLQQSEYVRANDTYLRLSIGNAPWPIGVTMVGIHERSAHEKINSGTVAHALNDEVTRKWIQSIKRLMTFCQKAHPPSDSSKAMG